MSAASRRRLSGDVIILVALLLLFAVLSFRLMSPNDSNTNPLNAMRRSSYIADSGGWMAYYRLLQQRGDKVERWIRSPQDWPTDAGVIVTGPYGRSSVSSAWTDQDAQAALKWVEAGGTLVAFTASNDALTDTIGLASVGTGTDEEGKDAAASPSPSVSPSPSPSPSASPQNSDEDEENTGPETVNVSAGAASAPVSVRQPVAFLYRVHKISPADTLRYATIPAAGVVLVADSRPIVVGLAKGKGAIIAISDAGLVDNAHLANADNARFAVQLVEGNIGDAKRPRILFDEYHQDYQQSESLWTAIGKPGQFACWQLLTLALLIAYSASRRFGLARPMPEPPRVSSEYVASLADLYRRARATDAALESVYQLFWRDLCRVAEMPSTSAVPAIAKRAAALSPAVTDAERKALASRIEIAVNECREKIAASQARFAEQAAATEKRARKKERSSARGISETDMLRLAREIEALRKELELGGAANSATAPRIA